MKKMIALLLALMVLLLAGCGSNGQEEIDKLNAELEKVSAIRTVHAIQLSAIFNILPMQFSANNVLRHKVAYCYVLHYYRS